MTSQNLKRRRGTEVFGEVALAVHGGAGALTRGAISAEREQEYLQHLESALRAGFVLLKRGKRSLDAVEAAVLYLEDCPLFNAGHGSVFTADGTFELDAAIMDGRTRRAGAVAAVSIVRNPISAARAVMQDTKHVMLTGAGAELVAAEAGVQIVNPSYFFTEQRRKQWEELGHDKQMSGLSPAATMCEPIDRKFGTVGAVARDRRGNLAAATSTGGTMGKRAGRVGDSPIIGAGTYADNATCAVSTTGHGESFMRTVAAYDVSALMKYRRMGLARAASQVVQVSLESVQGQGGLIAIDAAGNCALPFNTPGMLRGSITTDGEVYTAIYR
ncbi:MAG TPA: isoaspartyl peptidase/L-asparaginase [Candidatus Obscuribacterales bacterium]